MVNIKLGLRMVAATAAVVLTTVAQASDASANQPYSPNDPSATRYIGPSQQDGYFHCTSIDGYPLAFGGNSANLTSKTGTVGTVSCLNSDVVMYNEGFVCKGCDIVYIFWGQNYTGAYTALTKWWSWSDTLLTGGANAATPRFTLGGTGASGYNQGVWVNAASEMWGG